MKKMIILLGLVLAGCTSKTPDVVKAPVCAVQKAISLGVANVISTSLECSNRAAIDADITKALAGLKLCPETTAQGPVGALICPLVVGAVTGLVKDKVPATWTCKVSDTSKLADLLKVACISVLPLSN